MLPRGWVISHAQALPVIEQRPSSPRAQSQLNPGTLLSPGARRGRQRLATCCGGALAVEGA
eukprot:329758-Lingulodinium_polyedra.AAC.1